MSENEDKPKKKITYVHGYFKKVGDKRIHVPPHYRNVLNPEKKEAKRRRRAKERREDKSFWEKLWECVD